MCGSVARMWRGARSGEAEAGRGPDPPSHCLVFIEPMDFLAQQHTAGKENVPMYPPWCDQSTRPYGTIQDLSTCYCPGLE